MEGVSFAVVDFFQDKAPDGTTPCEIVPMCWVSEDLQKCVWPGSRNYIKAFKHTEAPKQNWISHAAVVKFISPDLKAARKYRDELIKDGSASSAQDSDLDRCKQNKNIPRKQKPPSLVKAVSPMFVEPESSESEKESPPLKRKIARLPSPPNISPALIGLVRQNNLQPLATSSGSLELADDILVVDVSTTPTVMTSSSQEPRLYANGETSSRRGAGIDKVLLQRMERLERKMDEVIEILKQQKTPPGSIVQKPDDCPELPLQEMSSVDELEYYLSFDDHVDALVPFLTRTGGRGEKEATERVLAEILADKIASNFNWMGIIRKDQPKKIGFKKYKAIVRLVKQTVKTMESGATDKGIESAIQYWLKHSKRRIPKSPSNDEIEY